MRVVIYAQDLSGRRDDGYFTKPSISDALDLYFSKDSDTNYIDDEGAEPIVRSDAESIFNAERRVTFFNADGEKVVISLDPSAAA